MPTPQSPLVQVLAAENPAGDDSQDRIFIFPNAALVLDGASDPTPQERDGGWYADTLGQELRARLERDPDKTYVSCCAKRSPPSRAPGLVPGVPRRAPSRSFDGTRGSRRTGPRRQRAPGADGRPLDVLHDTRLEAVAADTREAIRARLAAGAGYGEEHDALVRHLVEQERAHRNRPGGYWIAEATPEAADHALTRANGRRQTCGTPC